MHIDADKIEHLDRLRDRWADFHIDRQTKKIKRQRTFEFKDKQTDRRKDIHLNKLVE